MGKFIAGYVLLSVIVLLILNLILRNRGRKKKMESPLLDKRAPEMETMPAPPEKAETQVPAKTDEGLAAEPEKMETRRARTDDEKRPAEAPGRAAVPPEVEEEHGRGKIVFAMMLGAFVAILNQTLLNVAIPHIMNDLNVTANTVQWLSTGYMLVNGILVPVTAFMISKWGTRKMLITAVSLFTAGSVLCAISTNFSILMLGRIVQASGAGIIMPLMMTVFLTIFPPEKRGSAMGMMGVAMIFAPAIGPTLSGWLVGHYDWHILFWIVIPFGVIDIFVTLAWMKDVMKTTNPKIDIPGIIFSTLGFGFLLYGFSEAGNDGWSSKQVVISLIIAVISLVLFVWRELTTEKPMLDLRVFKYDIFALTTIVSMVVNMAMFAGMILLPIYLQNIRGFTALDSGLLMLPGAIVMGIMSPISGWLFDKLGARPLAVFGLIITVWTTYEFTKLSMTTSYGHLLFLYVLRSFGMSFIMMTIMTEGMNQLPIHMTSHGTAAANTARTVAGSLGTAFLVTVMSTRADFHTANYVNAFANINPYVSAKIAAIGQGLAHASGLPSQYGQVLGSSIVYQKSVVNATISGINDAFFVATGIAAFALILSFFIKRAMPQPNIKK
ncbi:MULTISPECIES: DHA2 family efflux MFS transporter permease subunit [Heyndrickxia]|uniref:DHA2 family efflux MFS transporter permease subunit n=1 Tax=Heyndrickxia TaxID=2837504 RepID=UPI00040681C5|nr:MULTISPECIES: DHA2 family efflux MFS transporter permease subunit [Heyndrickxia]AVD56569.1 MFS transporter [Heyndrickxia coagulans]AWP37433.1 MFS transporter [Heyndrickxia coagulans]MEC2304283.1 DHA2 family efflux MFS transporter permease subunit [Weizmannia sp. CD-2023]MEC2341753.1 DHA2 family efflux MFS transporter permease subunit [Weizmannia sp. CD-2023]QDI62932.1 DHA2 family efflux MFS transporter permease subunit [Heyndrickxia coagulans]